MSAVQQLFAAFERCPERIAFRRGPDTLTYAELDQSARAYAASLRDRGVRPGDRIALFAASSLETIIALFGHYRARAVHVPINTRYRGPEVQHILETSRPALIISDEDGRGIIAQTEYAKGVPILEASLIRDIATSRVVAVSEDAPADDDDALMIFTSGTTGKSKGVVLQHRAVVANIAALTGLWRWRPDDRLLLALPLFHVHGLCIGVHGGVLNGMETLVHPRFDASAVVEAFAAENPPTVFMGVPTMYARLLEHLDEQPERGRALADARLFTSGSAPLPARDFRRFEAHTGHAIVERYGMSETLLTLSNPHDGERRPGSVGMPVPGCEARIVDDAGAPAGPGKTGELQIRSNGIMRGYHGDDAATSASFVTTDSGPPWFSTGDVARQADDGYYTVVGRKSVDIIKSGGFKISAREIEEVIGTLDGVREAAIVGLADPTWGQRIAVAIVPFPSAADLDGPSWLAHIETHVADKLADYKRPREVIVVPELPRNALGKIQKHRLIAEWPADRTASD